MLERLYNPVISGEVRFSDNGGFSYFWPNDLPFDIELKPKTKRRMQDALISLSKLDGKVSQMSKEERDVLLIPFVLMESTNSSAIEGTGTTIEDLYISERIGERDVVRLNDNMEVLNYRDAMDLATGRGSKSITEDLILDMHSILMKGVRGETKSPGAYRVTQVLVGRKGDTLDTARFVPMPPEQVPWKIMNLLEYINDDCSDALLSAAMSHYQFETIHPFADGNGRMGRLLIMLVLNKNGILEHPVLYLSRYFNDHRDEYISSLNRIRECDDFESWIELFLDALLEQTRRSAELIDYLSGYRKQLFGMEKDMNVIRTIDSLFANPYVRKKDVANICGVHPSTAGRIVEHLVRQGVLVEITGNKRNRMYVCNRIMDLLNMYRSVFTLTGTLDRWRLDTSAAL